MPLLLKTRYTTDMNIQKNVPLAPYTSFGVGGPAEHFALVKNADELEEALGCTLYETQLWTIGYGSNSLISDKGLSGMVLCIRGGRVVVDENLIIADAGAWWDDVVVTAISHSLWGIELMSEIPGSVGAAAYINITAYGQSIGSVIEWIEVWDRKQSRIRKLSHTSLQWEYKSSLFQTDEGKNLVIVRVGIRLQSHSTNQLSYQKAIDAATELGLDIATLDGRRQAIIEARRRAGSLWHPDKNDAHTVGSFFRNPVVSSELAEKIMSFDETGKTHEEIKKMNRVHGGSEQRVSAAHVMLAAGFFRGQTWNNKVKLNDQNLLKIEALAGACAQDIYTVMKIIQRECEKKLGIILEPEARILGEFAIT